MTSILLSIFMTYSSTALHSEKIEARVGSEIITSTDIEREVERLKEIAPEEKTSASLRKIAFDRLIEIELIQNYLSGLQIEVTAQDVDRRIQSILQSQGISNLEEFRKMLSMQGISLNSFRAQIKKQMLVAQFNQLLERQSIQTLSDQELKAYYKNNEKDFASNMEVEIQECLIPNEGSSQAAPLIEKYQSSASVFDECVALHSRAPSAQLGGNLGTVGKDSLRPEVAQKVFSAEKNSVVKIELPGAIQLLKIKNKVDKGQIAFEDAKPIIRQKIRDERLQKTREDLLKDLRARTYIRVDS